MPDVSGKLDKSGGTMTGQLTMADGVPLKFGNNTLNMVGDDVSIGDQNIAGALIVRSESADVAGEIFIRDPGQIEGGFAVRASIINETISRASADAGLSNAIATNAAAIATKEPAIAAGATSQYWRGDKTWQTFPSIPNISGKMDVPAASSLLTGTTSVTNRPFAIRWTLDGNDRVLTIDPINYKEGEIVMVEVSNGGTSRTSCIIRQTGHTDIIRYLPATNTDYPDWIILLCKGASRLEFHKEWIVNKAPIPTASLPNLGANRIFATNASNSVIGLSYTV